MARDWITEESADTRTQCYQRVISELKSTNVITQAELGSRAVPDVSDAAKKINKEAAGGPAHGHCVFSTSDRVSCERHRAEGPQLRIIDLGLVNQGKNIANLAALGATDDQYAPVRHAGHRVADPSVHHRRRDLAEGQTTGRQRCSTSQRLTVRRQRSPGDEYVPVGH